MVSRNVLKIDMPDQFYHIYSRGVNKQPLFVNDDDYMYFLHLLRRYLSPPEIKNSAGIPYEKLYMGIEVVCYCLMPNHFHLLAYQRVESTMQRLMRGVVTAYSGYFNTKYKRTGPLFESRYKAVMITDDAYLEHITRYIHLNPREWATYPYSSLNIYRGRQHTDWLKPDRITNLFKSAEDYYQFVADYQAIKQENDEIKRQLANEG